MPFHDLVLTLMLTPLSLCRPACRVVSSRTGLQKADEQLISLMMNENEGRSSYVVVMTKCDKVNDKKVRERERETGGEGLRSHFGWRRC